MQLKPNFSFAIIILFSSMFSFGQNSVGGVVVDSKSNEPLAFVQIIVNGSIQTATSTDIDGKFSYESDEELRTLSLSSIWYKDLEVIISAEKNPKGLKIGLVSDTENLDIVTVLPGINPANRIIENTIINKVFNDPQKLNSYSCESYNKVVYDMKIRDSIYAFKLDSTLAGGHMMIMESVTEKKYLAPALTEEVVVGTKISGFQLPTFAILATDLQPFSFYKEQIEMFDIVYLNPISNGSLNKYKFRIEDTILNPTDTTYILSFEPKKGKNFDGLKGLLYINTNKFAIQNVIATPFEKGPIDIKIQQQYEFIDNVNWFPTQLNFELFMLQEENNDFGLVSNGKSYIRNIKFNPELKRRDFGIESTKLADDAGEKDSLFWENQRYNEITIKETITYQVIDSLGKEMKLDKLVKLSEKLGAGKLPIAFVDLDLKHSVIQNDYEGYRAGIGIQTNEKISKVVSVGGFYGYGLKDNESKFGGNISLILSKEHEFELTSMYQNTLSEVGSSTLDQFLTPSGLRQYMSNRMSRIEGYNFDVGFRAFRYLKMKFSASQFSSNPTFEYSYQDNNSNQITAYNVGELSIGMRFAFREKMVNMFGKRMSLGSKFPILLVNYSKSDRGLLNADYTYNKIEAVLEGNYRFKGLGDSKIRIEGGYLDELLPYTLLFTGDGSFAPKKPLIVKNYFQTVTPYEFLTDQYVNVHFSHHFGSLLFKSKNFRPQIVLHQKASWGRLSNPSGHQLIAFKTQEKGLFEAGLQLDNLLRINYLNVGFIGLGVGMFYRYGPYSNAKSIDNAAFKLSIVYSSK